MTFYTVGDPHPDGSFDGPCCPAVRPDHPPFLCTRPEDHDSLHVATGVGGKIMAAWA